MSDQPTSRPAPSNTVLLWISETALLFGCYILAAFLQDPDNLEIYLLYDGGFVQILIVVLVIQIGLWLQMLYNSPRVSSRAALAIKLVLVLGAAFLFQVLWFYLNPMMLVPRLVMLLGSLLVLIALPLWRMVFAALQQRQDSRRLLLIGKSPTLRELTLIAQNQPDTFFVIASVLENLDLGSMEDVVSNTTPTHIVIAGVPPNARDLLNLQWSGLQVMEATAFYETVFRRVPIEELQSSDLILSKSYNPVHSAMPARILSAALGTILLPLGMGIAIALRLLGGGPILICSPRRGWRGKTFQLYQFRVSRTPEKQSWLDRLLLRSGLCRLPELLNVIRGDMAFIGPRPMHPDIAEEVERQIPFYRHRGVIRPGLFGWAQVNLPRQEFIDPAVELEYDLYYIKYQDAALNMFILGHSLGA